MGKQHFGKPKWNRLKNRRIDWECIESEIVCSPLALRAVTLGDGQSSINEQTVSTSRNTCTLVSSHRSLRKLDPTDKAWFRPICAERATKSQEKQNISSLSFAAVVVAVVLVRLIFQPFFNSFYLRLTTHQTPERYSTDKTAISPNSMSIRSHAVCVYCGPLQQTSGAQCLADTPFSIISRCLPNGTVFDRLRARSHKRTTFSFGWLSIWIRIWISCSYIALRQFLPLLFSIFIFSAKNRTTKHTQKKEKKKKCKKKICFVSILIP